MEKEIKEIVLTGGPCSGKTTGRSYLTEKLRDRGFRVFLVPEIPTIIIDGGVSDIIELKKKDPRKYYEVEKEMLSIQMAVCSHFRDLAKVFNGEKGVIIYDRGPIDVKAYVGPGEFESIMDELRLNLYDVRDSFDGVIHLITAAKGAEKFYACDNNKARLETTLEEARIIDEKTLQVWLGHQHLRIIDNSTDFEKKMHRTLQAISRILGIPVPLEIERKFLLSRIPDFAVKELQLAQKISIEQIYVNSSSGEETRIRKRSQNGFSVYYLTRKVPVGPGVRNEREEEIRAIDYMEMQKEQIHGSKIIRKNRYCFAYNNQYFELDIITEPKKRCLLEIELTEEGDRLELPDFLKIKKEVTGDERYSNYALATK